MDENNVYGTAPLEEAPAETAAVLGAAVARDERTAIINIGGVDFELMLTTKATKTIGKRDGGL